MPHRSAEEALRAQLSDRERELADAKRELEAAEILLYDQSRENARLRRGAPTRRELPFPPVAVATLVGISFVAVALTVGVVGRSWPARPTSAVAPRRGTRSPAPPVAPAPVLPTPVDVRFRARVTDARGVASVHAGDDCILTAAVVPGVVLRVHDLAVDCGATRLYDLDEPARSGTMDNQAFAWRGAEHGTARVEVDLTDIASDEGRPSVLLHSWSGDLSIWGPDPAGPDLWRVELELDPVSEPTDDVRLVGLAHGEHVHALRHGRVVSTNRSGLLPGTPCRIAARLRPSPEPGRVHVRCGAVTLYGAGSRGFAARDGDVVTDPEVTLEDGDPALALDLVAGTLALHDGWGDARELVEIALDPPAP